MKKIFNYSLAVVFTVMCNLVVLAQMPEAHIYVVQTWYATWPEGGTEAERDTLIKQYFNKVTMKNPYVLHEWHLRHLFTEDSREYVIIGEYKSLSDLVASEAKFEELEKAAWPDEKIRGTFFDKFDSYYSYHNDKIFRAVEGLLKPGEMATGEHVFNLQTWYMNNKPGNRRTERDSLSRIYFNNVNMKNSFELSHIHMTHYYTEDSREYVMLTEYKSLADITPGTTKMEELEKATWPDEKQRETMFKKFDTYFTHHSDKLFRSLPGMMK